MAVGGVGRGGGRGGPKGVGGKPASGGTFKVTGNEGAGKAESLVGASRAAGTSEAGPVAATDPIAAGAQAIAKALKEGKIASKQEATQQLVGLILKNKNLNARGGKGAQKLIDQIVDTLNDDPRLTAALERTWARAGENKK